MITKVLALESGRLLKMIINFALLQGSVPPSPMRMFFIAFKHFVISSIARFFSDGTSNREMLSRTERTRSWGVLGLFDRLNRKAMFTHEAS